MPKPTTATSARSTGSLRSTRSSRSTAPRWAATTAALALALTLGACGGTDDEAASEDAGASTPSPTAGDTSAPTEAPADVVEFCGAYGSVVSDLSAITGTPAKQASQGVSIMKSWATSMTDLGTPASMPDEAVAGFQVLVGLIDDLDDDSSLDELQSADSDLSEADNASGLAFTTWIGDNCVDPAATGGTTP